MKRVALLFALAAASLPLSVACGQADAARTPRTPSRFEPEIVAAEALLKRGDRAGARRAADALVDRIEAVASPSSADRTVLGRAYILLGDGDAGAVRAALAAFDAARAADPSNLEPELRAGNLFLDKYNAPDARASFETVLRASPNDASALLGLARVEDFEGKGTALATVRRAVAADPTHADALTMLARLHLEAEQYDSASANARRAIAADSGSIGAWALLGATAWLTGDSATYRSAHQSATRLQPRPADFLVELAEAAVRNRRYTDAVRFAEQAVELDPQSTRALGVLGTNQLRIGRMREGQASLDRAFAIDPFNLWHKNTLDLLDKMGSFRTIDRGRFQVVAPAEEAELLALYVVPMLERAYDSLAIRYGYRPPTPVRLEFFRQHADFSVRSVGLAGLGALGVSFGSLLAMDTPSAREQGAFNWGSTALHELTHAFTLGASGHRVPRWLSEGMSVLEERRAGRGWGADASLPFLGALARGGLRPMSQLNDGFLRPRHPQETEFSYYQASLFSEMVEAQKGAAALPAMLRAYREGLGTPEVFQRVLGMTAPQVDAAFDTYIRTRFARPLQSVVSADSTRGSPFVRVMQEAVALMEQPTGRDSARALFTRALAMYPEYGGDDGPAWYLAKLERERGNVEAALAAVSQVTMRNETAWEANQLEAELREGKGDDAGAMAALERLLWISPYDPAIHARLAALAAKRGDHATAVRERRAVIAVNPPDLLDARYELARALAASGDAAGARRELLSVLEAAPSFEKAQALLLELRGRAP